jgi:hypothetical protein
MVTNHRESKNILVSGRVVVLRDEVSFTLRVLRQNRLTHSLAL